MPDSSSTSNRIFEKRYAMCTGCGNVMLFDTHKQLFAAVSCDGCGAPEQFGPGILREDFEGWTMDQAIDYRASLRNKRGE